jgi:hypothetical protein
MFGRHERTFNLVNGPMVHLTSQTAIVDDAGKLALRDDIYGFDARIEAILHGGAHHIAGVRTHQDIRHRAERREAKNPSRLFGRPTLPQRPEPKLSVGGA